MPAVGQVIVRIVNATAGMTNASTTVLPSLITTLLPGSAETRKSSVVKLVTLSRSDEPVSNALTRSIVGRCGASVSSVSRNAPLASLMLPARSSSSAVIS